MSFAAIRYFWMHAHFIHMFNEAYPINVHQPIRRLLVTLGSPKKQRKMQSIRLKSCNLMEKLRSKPKQKRDRQDTVKVREWMPLM